MSWIIAPTTLNEFFPIREQAATAVAGLVMGGLIGCGGAGRVLWARHSLADIEVGATYMPGLCEYGFDPARIIMIRSTKTLDLLQAGLEGARTVGLGAVVIELWGEAKAYDLTASRRLALAARTSGVTVIITRISASPRPSAAERRWRVETLPSRPLLARAPGPPRFAVSLLRARNGHEGLSYHLEWDRDERHFTILSSPDHKPNAHPRRDSLATLSGIVVAFPSSGEEQAPFRRAG